MSFGNQKKIFDIYLTLYMECRFLIKKETLICVTIEYDFRTIWIVLLLQSSHTNNYHKNISEVEFIREHFLQTIERQINPIPTGSTTVCGCRFEPVDNRVYIVPR